MKINKQILISLVTMVVTSFLLFYLLPYKIKSINDLLFSFGGYAIGFFVSWLLIFRKKKDNGINRIVFIQPSIIGIPFNAVSAIIISSLFTAYIYSQLTIGTWILSFALILFLVAAFLLVPKKIVLDSKIIINDRFWREKWENIKECRIYDDVLEIKTKNNRTRTIKKLDKESLVIIKDFFKQQMEEQNIVIKGEQNDFLKTNKI